MVSPVDSFYAGNVLTESWITDATLSKDMRHIALLSQNKVWLISDFHRDLFLQGYIQEIELGHFSQKESICFKNDSILVIADETGKLGKGKLYELNINTEITLLDSLRKMEVSLTSKKFKDSVHVTLNSVVAADVYFEIFNGNMTRVDFGRVDFFEPGEHSFSIVPKNMINGSYMLNIKVGNRPHGFFVNRFKEVDWDELYRVRDSIQRSR